MILRPKGFRIRNGTQLLHKNDRGRRLQAFTIQNRPMALGMSDKSLQINDRISTKGIALMRNLLRPDRYNLVYKKYFHKCLHMDDRTKRLPMIRNDTPSQPEPPSTTQQNLFAQLRKSGNQMRRYFTIPIAPRGWRKGTRRVAWALRIGSA